jgi:hypothetical protein
LENGAETSEKVAFVWDLGTIVLGGLETELTMQVHMDTSDGELLQEVSMQVGTALQVTRQKLPLSFGGEIQLTVTQGGTAPNFRLSEYGVSPSTRYEKSALIAAQQAVRLEDVSDMGPMIVGTAPLPDNLQGLWWLTSQKSGSALVTFGGPNDDGNGCNLGYLTGDKNSYKIRVEGERVFSSAEPAAMDKMVEPSDQSYNFEFNDPVNPTMAQIYVFSDGFGIHIYGPASEHMMDFEMHLLPDGDSRRNPYPGSLVWLRNTTFWHINAGEDYLLVQVMDGSGSKIEPAWSKFVGYENSKATGSYPGWMFYKSNVPSPSPGAPEVVEKVVKSVDRGVGAIILVTALLCCLCIAATVYCCVRLRRERLANPKEESVGTA